MKNHRIINCHSHIFTIDHVPDEFGKSLLPWPFYRILSIRTIKWYYKNLTVQGSKKYRSFIHQRDKILFKLKDILKFTVVLWAVYYIILRVFKWLFKITITFLRWDSLFSPEVKALIERYKTLARYSINYKDQSSIFNFLKKNYPAGARFVVLSMDMEYMEAGKPKISYLDQIDELVRIKAKKEDMLPFIFADPRRIAETSDKQGKGNYINLMMSLLSRKIFNGIKIYPALGYYPFDKDLIPLYEFAREYDIPIMTHCIRGTVFYRGKKKEEWSQHPILQYNSKEGDYKYIPFPQKKNYEFTTNFTHPLNYHCLLNKELLSRYLGVEKDLSGLKICLGHFGGEDEWTRYSQDAWNNYNNNIAPIEKSLYLLRKNTLDHASTRTIWWNASWLSVIYDLMVVYENVYADVSFILHNRELYPTLKYILQDEKVRHKILFGTDYYVVAQKGVDKWLYQNFRSYMGEELFMQMAETNAGEFIRTKFA